MAEHRQRRQRLSLLLDGRVGTQLGVKALDPLRKAVDEMILVLDANGRQPLPPAAALADQVTLLEPGQEVRDPCGVGACAGEWVLLLKGDEVPGRQLLHQLGTLMDNEEVDVWWFPCRAVYPDHALWLRSEPWFPWQEPRLMRTAPGRPMPAARIAGVPIYYLGFMLAEFEDRWRSALRDEVAATANPAHSGRRGFRFWLPERSEAPALEPLPPSDAGLVRALLPHAAAPLIARTSGNDDIAGSNRDDDLRALTMPALSPSAREAAPTLESLRCRRREHPIEKAPAASIPRIVHRIWLGRRPFPERFRRNGDSWERCHPGWCHRLWTEDDLPALLCAPVLHRARFFAEQADLIRYELLARFGGVYVDVDVECLRNLEPVLSGVQAFAAFERRGWIGNAILGSTPGHPAFCFALERAMELVGLGHHTVNATGPFMLTRVLAEFPSVVLFGHERFYPYAWNETPCGQAELRPAYAVHQWALSHLRPAGSDDVAMIARELQHRCHDT